MRYPRPLGEDEVDRAGVEVRQRMELTATNRSYAYPETEGQEWGRKADAKKFLYVVFRVCQNT